MELIGEKISFDLREQVHYRIFREFYNFLLESLAALVIKFQPSRNSKVSQNHIIFVTVDEWNLPDTVIFRWNVSETSKFRAGLNLNCDGPA